MLTLNPAAVAIRSCRTDQLPSDEAGFIRQHYVPLADDFWVLGTMLPPSGGTFEVVRPGRYQITTREASCIQGTIEFNSMGLVVPPVKTNCAGTLNGVLLTGKPVELTVGTHRVDTASTCQPAVVWVGPELDRLRPLEDQDHRLLFNRWY